MAVDPDTGSGSVRLIRMGSVSGMKSFLALVDWGGLGEGEGEEDIFSRREKSSGSVSGVRRDTMNEERQAIVREKPKPQALYWDSISRLAASSLICPRTGRTECTGC